MDIAEDESQTSNIDGRNEGKDDGHRTKDSPDWNSGSAQSHTGDPFDEFGDNNSRSSSHPCITFDAVDDEPVSASSPHPPMVVVEDEMQTSDIDGKYKGKDDGHMTEDSPNWNSGSAQSHTDNPFDEFGDNSGFDSSPYPGTIPNNAFDDEPNFASFPPPIIIVEDELQASNLDGGNEDRDDDNRMEDLLNQDSGYDQFHTGEPFDESGDNTPRSASSTYLRTIPNAFDDRPVSTSSPHPHMVIIKDQMQTSDLDGRNESKDDGHRMEDLSLYAYNPQSASLHHPHMSFIAEDQMSDVDGHRMEDPHNQDSEYDHFQTGHPFNKFGDSLGSDSSSYPRTIPNAFDDACNEPVSASSPHPPMVINCEDKMQTSGVDGRDQNEAIPLTNLESIQSRVLVKVPIGHNMNVKADNPGYGTYPFSALTGVDFPHHPTGSYDVNNAHNDAESLYVQPETPADFRFDYRNFKIDSSFYPVHVPLNAINTFELNEDRSNCFRPGPDESERNTGADTSSENSTVDELFQSMPNGQEQVPGYSNHNMHRDTCLNKGDLARIGHQSSSFNAEGLLLVPSPALGINTPSSSDMPSTSEYNMKGLSAFDDTGCDADDEGVDDGDGDWEMQYEDVGLANNGNATQISSDYDGVRAFKMEVPHTHMSHNTHVDHHYLPCNSSHETCNCDSRPQNFVSHNHLEVPPVQGGMLTPESHGTFGDTNNQQGVTPLLPLTEIPDIPMAAESSIEDEKYLRMELESLVASCVKSVSMKSHFTSQLNQPPFDKVKLRSLLDSCYRYVGVLTDHDPPSPSSHPDTSHLFLRHGPKLYKAPQHRPHSKVELAEHVRYEVGCLLGRVNDQHNPEFTAKPLSTVPSTTIDSWRRSGAGGPTLDNFVLQLRDGKYTDWNKTAAQVFSRYLCSWEEYKGFTVKSIEEAFLAHLSQLRKDFEHQGRLKSINERDAEQRMRRLRRRNAELRRRISSLEEILACHSDVLRELRDVYKRITVKCISGDESESGPEPNSDWVYYRTSCVWSSKQFEEFQILLRAWHVGSRYIGGGKYSNDIASRGLPRNWYDPDWLMRNSSQAEILAVGPDVPLTLPQEEVRTQLYMYNTPLAEFVLLLLTHIDPRLSQAVAAVFFKLDILLVAMGKVVKVNRFNTCSLDQESPVWNKIGVLPSPPVQGEIIEETDVQSVHSFGQDKVLVSYKNGVAVSWFLPSLDPFVPGFGLTAKISGIINDVCPEKETLLVTDFQQGTYKVLRFGAEDLPRVFIPRTRETATAQPVSVSKFISTDMVIGGGVGQIILWSCDTNNRLQNLIFRNQRNLATQCICAGYKSDQELGLIVTAHNFPDRGEVVIWKTFDLEDNVDLPGKDTS
ncbi:hypothetical protein F5051DRAFT_434033 [Lentinula edodes]|nr:hypothetical protein F5051DRAFT_434033 [Lentinula edodes]